MACPALFLDRDGVVNVDYGYVVTHERFTFMDGIFDLTRLAVDLGYRVVVVTNQSGIARGYFSDAEYRGITDWMIGTFRGHGVEIADVLHCPYHREAAVARFQRDSFWRKPAPGMILEAARRHDLDLDRSLLLGDQPTDMLAAAAAGVGMRVLVRPQVEGPAEPADAVIARLPEALPLLTDWTNRRRGNQR